MKTQNREGIHTGLFEDRDSAEAGYAAAVKRGYRPEEINVLMSEDSKKKYYGTPIAEKGTKSVEGLALGGLLGGTALGTIGALVALSSTIVVPGIGLVIAGPLAAALAGAGAGSVAGGLVGALIGAGIPEDRVKFYESGIKKGGVVVAVPAREDDDELLEDWRNAKGKDIF